MFATLSPSQTYCENSSMLLFIFTVWNTSLKSESSAFEILILSMQVSIPLDGAKSARQLNDVISSDIFVLP